MHYNFANFLEYEKYLMNRKIDITFLR